MAPMLTDEDLSLRHLPEVSDYSFSFQIPSNSLPKGSDLMADDNTFFEGANPNFTLSTPAPLARVATQPLTRIPPEFASRPSTLESSTPSQLLRTSLPSEPPRTSYGHVESHSSPITEAAISSKRLGGSEAEGSNEEWKHEHQDQEESPLEQDPCSSASAASSATLNSILSPTTFPKRSSPLVSQPEDGVSGLDLLQAESRVVVLEQSAATDEVNTEQLGNANPKARRSSRLGTKAGRPVPGENPRPIADTKPRQPPVAGGILKSRKVKKAVATKSENGLVKTSLPAITSRAGNKRHTKPDKPMDPSDADRSQESNHGAPSFVPGAGAAGRLVSYSQQLMNIQNDTAGAINLGTGASYIPEHGTTQQDGHEIQDVKMDLDDRLDPCSISDTHANDFGDQDDDRDKPLTISQLSPRKRSAIRSSMVEAEDNSIPSVLPALKPTSGASNKKRRAPISSASRHDQQAQKRGKRDSNAVTVEAPFGSTTHVPVHTIASTSSSSQSTVASAASSVTLELGTGGASVNRLDVIVEKEGGKKEAGEENLADDEHAKIQHPSEMISTSDCGRSAQVAGSGPTKTSKQLVKRPVEIGARSRTRRVSKSSSSANGGRSLRPRTVSNSITTRADVLRANERGKRLAQIRTRKGGRAKDQLGKSGRLEGGTGSVGSNPMSGSASDLGRSDMTYPTSSMRPIEFKFASDLRVQQRMTRSTSSLSSSSGGGNNASTTRTQPIPDFKTIHGHNGASQARKENVHPVTTQPFHWATDERIKQRKEFDDMVKEKEKERQQREEQVRKEREEEEEREIRELRRRLVPKANVVPEWYKDAPKKKKEEETMS
ncbi:hypothetical protein NP233_g5636 [Leucocoprinus birnbaumii]|uniref:TPX2 C-terminal domain-containing protein n=1 Tax=Leucocoprinus birnbaumii TaxID=56174 RepID=A0AAD5VVZ0_9AGAR|nr:hypothetical protein NP233_g5636 [Leucocoprinus birnbaumii]